MRWYWMVLVTASVHEMVLTLFLPHSGISTSMPAFIAVSLSRDNLNHSMPEKEPKLKQARQQVLYKGKNM